MTQRIELSALCALVSDKSLSVETHSGKVALGGVFAVVPPPLPRGTEHTQPGNEIHLEAALERKPAYVVCEERLASFVEDAAKDAGLAGIAVVQNPRAALGSLAAAAYGTDKACPQIIGITGTNGKTTEAYLLEALLSAAGRKVGVLGTVSYRWPGHYEDAPLTTPGCLALHSLMARMHKAGADTAVIEVSSHALDQERAAGLAFEGALITNLTQDHLDYHKDMEEYFQAKARLFLTPEEGGVPRAEKARAANADDPFCRRILALKEGAVGFGLMGDPVSGSRHLHGKILSLTPDGMRLEMNFEGKTWVLNSPLTGSFNAMNLLGAQALGLALGLAPETFAALEHFTGVPGRLERVANPRGLHAFVDYAHTPDALVNALTALRAAGFKRVVTVFGCGGNRDRTKRPLMGEAVARLSDVAVLTSDNPRHEDPLAIMEDVKPGLAGCRQVIAEPDRRKALEKAVALLGPDDALLVAGKGHETYQQIGDVKTPFSDQAVLREILL